MAKHIGIVACSAEGAALCYRTICLEGSDFLGRHSHPEVSMHTHPLSEYMRHVKDDSWQGVADLILSSAGKLAAVGADFLICPDNTIHQAFDLVIAKSPIPWIHIAEEVASEAVRLNRRKLVVFGTQFLMEGPVYRQQLFRHDLQYKIPELEDRKRINSIIFDELVNGEIKAESRSYFTAIIERMKEEENCDAVVLGCTEIPLLIQQKHSPIPVLDSTRLLARAALKLACNVP